MKRLFIQVFALSVLVTSVNPLWAASNYQYERTSQHARAALCREVATETKGHTVLAQQGCCSWHSGVCGCSGGRVTCCDGTTSPTCGCNSDEPSLVNK